LERFLGKVFTEDSKDIIEVKWFREAKDAFAFNIWIEKSDNVKASDVTDVDRVFWILLVYDRYAGERRVLTWRQERYQALELLAGRLC
jgi:hypothetical protein